MSNMANLEYQSIWTRLVKYLLEGIAVAVAATLVSRKYTYSYQEIAILAATAALTFFLLDYFAPSIAFGARTGTGFGIGFNTVGGVIPGAAMAPLVGGGFDMSQTGGNAASEATGVDATSDAKELPQYLGYGTNQNPVITEGNRIVSNPSPLPGFGAETATVMPIAGNEITGSNLSGTGAVVSSGCLIKQGACANGSPLFTQPINNCDCTLDCKPQCQPELQCPVSCPVGQRVFPNCNIASNNSPFKIVPGMYSHQIILPGYNECVKPYNYYETPLGMN